MQKNLMQISTLDDFDALHFHSSKKKKNKKKKRKKFLNFKYEEI